MLPFWWGMCSWQLCGAFCYAATARRLPDCRYIGCVLCMYLCAYMRVHVYVIVLSAAFMHLRIYFAVPHCSSRVVNCPGGSMFYC